MRPPPEGAVQVEPAAGLLARGSTPSLGLPGAECSSGLTEGCSPLTVAGAAAESGKIPHRVPFYVPRNAGTDDGATITGFAAAASGWRDITLTRGGPAPLVAPSTVSHDESEQGTRYGFLVQFRGCPRNCKR